MSIRIFNGTGSKLDFYAESQCYTFPDDDTAARYTLFSGQKPVLSLPTHKTLQIYHHGGNVPRIANKAPIRIIARAIHSIDSLPPDFDVYAVPSEYALAYKLIHGIFPTQNPIATPETFIYSESGDIMGYLALAVYS